MEVNLGKKHQCRPKLKCNETRCNEPLKKI